MRTISKIFGVAILGTCMVAGTGMVAAVNADLRPERIHTTDAKKTQAYIRDGLFVGGDRSIDDVTIKDIRRAANSGFERVVIDLEATRGGEAPGVQRPPYYQVAVSADEDRAIVTVWGKPKLAFEPSRVMNALKKSPNLGPVSLYPRIEDETWSFVIGLKGAKAVEVFELTNPVRIIVDIRTQAKRL